jgi:diacylglycerol kinase
MSARAATSSAEMSAITQTRRAAWRERLVMLERGVMLGFRASSIVAIHFFCALIGLTAGLVLGLSVLQWAILLTCFTTSLSAELAHQAVKRLCRSASLGREDARSAVYLSAAATTLALCGGIGVSLVVLVSRGCELW